jgi:hypothetical protein
MAAPTMIAPAAAPESAKLSPVPVRSTMTLTTVPTR